MISEATKTRKRITKEDSEISSFEEVEVSLAGRVFIVAMAFKIKDTNASIYIDRMRKLTKSCSTQLPSPFMFIFSFFSQTSVDIFKKRDQKFKFVFPF